MQLIKGKEIADDILSNIKAKIEKEELKPTLAVILVGKNKASQIYVSLKEKVAREIGMNFKLYEYDANVEEKVILNKIAEINEDKNIHGLIVQLPLPEKLDKHKIINAINPEKDVDGFCDENQKCFFNNQETIFPVFPKAIIKMIESALLSCHSRENGNLSYEYGDPRIRKDDNFDRREFFKSKKATIICKSDDFGKIMQKTLEKIGIKASYILCDDLGNGNILKKSDIIITVCGKKSLINSQMTKNDAIIIDGGIIKEAEKVFGDVDLKSFQETDCLISPVPKGVGPVTVACLLENTYLAYCEFGNLGK
ncbi:MAG: bifunctional 5,10-methylenetetrahydrofolate dehydrogenase/5,10-methenyltetrahydrofolate cyclohydrolase [Parcubacteria group bacterium]|jgi:methylenetetrahydrofolate dehydrogenase (NADP+)/methenyltetrahydrofolate cyclohydrolase